MVDGSDRDLSTVLESATSGNGDSGFDVLTATSGATLELPDSEWILKAAFDRQGHDLVIEGRDGERLLIRDYFSHEDTPDLSFGEGALRGAIVERLAGPMAEGYAQAGASDGSAIGAVDNANGEAWVVHVDGSREPIVAGTAIYSGDVVETSPNGSLTIAFVDGTSLSLSEDARMVIDELVFDPAVIVGGTGPGTGSSLLDKLRTDDGDGVAPGSDGNDDLGGGVISIDAPNGDAFLKGTYIEIGVATNGTLGTTMAIPETFAAADHSANGGLSFFFNPAGVESSDPATGDAFLPGTSVETFSLGFTDGTGTFLSHNENAGQFTGIPMAFDSIVTGSVGTSIVSTGGVAGRMSLTQTVTLDGDASYFTISVMLTNLTDSAMSAIRYMRNNDPDQDADPASGRPDGAQRRQRPRPGHNRGARFGLRLREHQSLRTPSLRQSGRSRWRDRRHRHQPGVRYRVPGRRPVSHLDTSGNRHAR